jgi:arsenical pump membrane protein
LAAGRQGLGEEGIDIQVVATLAIAALAIAGVILRPWKWPEAIWAVSGAALLVLCGLLPPSDAIRAIGKGTDVYMFLVGMMLLSELARREGLFDVLAAHAVRHAKGSAKRLFALIYAAGTVVTIFMSNDATAVVLTPAVFAAAKAAKAKPLPYLLVCAFIANAASFVLPISNPANLVVFGNHMPPLGQWLARFALPSIASIAATFGVLFWLQRKTLADKIETDSEIPALSLTGRIAALGIGATAIALMTASAFDIQLGLPTLISGTATMAVVLVIKHEKPGLLLKDISWGILPLVAGLFVLVQGLDHIGLIDKLSAALVEYATQSPTATGWVSGVGLAVICNLMNNLPAGLIAGMAVTAAHVSPNLAGAVMIGIDLGPNLSVTGSLATILWLTALRREGEHVGAKTFLMLGLWLMPSALLPALAVVMMAN